MIKELSRRKALINETNESLHQLSNKHLLEKFAREHYLFKKPNEEIFVIVEQKSK